LLFRIRQLEEENLSLRGQVLHRDREDRMRMITDTSISTTYATAMLQMQTDHIAECSKLRMELMELKRQRSYAQYVEQVSIQKARLAESDQGSPKP
jgi:hypothetical protein